MLLLRNTKWGKISHYRYGIIKLCEDNHGAYPHGAKCYFLGKFWDPCYTSELDNNLFGFLDIFILKFPTLFLLRESNFITFFGGDDKVVQRSVDGPLANLFYVSVLLIFKILKQGFKKCISALCSLSEKESKFNLRLLPRRLLGRHFHREMDSTVLSNDVLFSLR